MPAIILNHDRHKVKLDDPRAPFQSPAYEPPSPEDWEVLDAQQGLHNLILKYGAERVSTWVRSLAAIAGEDIS